MTATSHNAHDAKIRAVLLQWLRTQRVASLIVQEWSIGNAIADVGEIREDDVIGYEIKSAADSFDRLVTQVPCYDRVFRFSVLVTVERRLSRACDYIPPHWGVMVATDDEIRVARAALPAPDSAPARLLWKTELEALAKIHGLRAAALKLARDESRENYRLFEESAHADGRTVLPYHEPKRPYVHRGHYEKAIVEAGITIDVPAALRARAGWLLPDGRSAREAARKLRLAQRRVD